MMKALSIWGLISNSLRREVPVMLLYVLESKGSSPGRQGFFMAVNAEGEMQGSVGGGIMEHKFAELARERLTAGRQEAFTDLRKQIHDASVPRDRSGMICSGEQTIFLYGVKNKDAATIRAIMASLERNKNGSLRLSPEGISFDETIPEKDFHFVMRSEDDWEYIEKTGYKNQLFIIGGGHCALAFSRLMRSMDFYIRIYEERRELKTLLENDFVHEKYFLNDYSELKELIPSGPSHYVVIMTLGYRTDDLALRALLEKEFNYLGVLGSAGKMKKLFEAYQKEGVNEQALNRVRTPVGLAIRSQTPEEIAVSIAAEIIHEKNKGLS